jgi:hypothetical protein
MNVVGLVATPDCMSRVRANKPRFVMTRPPTIVNLIENSSQDELGNTLISWRWTTKHMRLAGDMYIRLIKLTE